MQPFFQVRHFFESEQAQRRWSDRRSGEAQALTHAELYAVLNTVADSRHPLRNRALFLLSFLCGLRVGEIAQLKVGDVCGPRGLYHVFNLRPSTTKTKKGRSVYLKHPELRAALDAWLDQRQAPADAPLFVSERQVAFTPNTLQQLFRRHYTAAGLLRAKSHSGRATFATTLLNRGASIRDVQLLMGHQSVEMTAHYARRNQSRLGRLAGDTWPLDD